MRRLCLLVVFSLSLLVCTADATIFGTVRGVVHDPQHRPVADASVNVKSATSEWRQTAVTDQDGAFSFGGFHYNDPRQIYVSSATDFTTDGSVLPCQPLRTSPSNRRAATAVH